MKSIKITLLLFVGICVGFYGFRHFYKCPTIPIGYKNNKDYTETTNQMIQDSMLEMSKETSAIDGNQVFLRENARIEIYCATTKNPYLDCVFAEHGGWLECLCQNDRKK